LKAGTASCMSFYHFERDKSTGNGEINKKGPRALS